MVKPKIYDAVLSKTPNGLVLGGIDAIIYFDGGSRGNPGFAAGAAIIKDSKGNIIAEVTEFIEYATNNQAEYKGLLLGLQKAIELKLNSVKVFGDSKLVVNQVNGIWDCNKEHLLPLIDTLHKLKQQFKLCLIQYIPRESNNQADALVNRCLNAHTEPTYIRKIAERLPVNQPLEKIADEINRIKALGESARFKDYMHLRSGNDKYSRISLSKLIDLVPLEVCTFIAASMVDYKQEHIAKVFRWWMRGLPVDMAVRKVKTDLEVTANVTGTSIEVYGKKESSTT